MEELPLVTQRKLRLRDEAPSLSATAWWGQCWISNTDLCNIKATRWSYLVEHVSKPGLCIQVMLEELLAPAPQGSRERLDVI
jgi:hypothetical protein